MGELVVNLKRRRFFPTSTSNAARMTGKAAANDGQYFQWHVSNFFLKIKHYFSWKISENLFKVLIYIYIYIYIYIITSRS